MIWRILNMIRQCSGVYLTSINVPSVDNWQIVGLFFKKILYNFLDGLLIEIWQKCLLFGSVWSNFSWTNSVHTRFRVRDINDPYSIAWKLEMMAIVIICKPLLQIFLWHFWICTNFSSLLLFHLSTCISFIINTFLPSQMYFLAAVTCSGSRLVNLLIVPEKSESDISS